MCVKCASKLKTILYHLHMKWIDEKVLQKYFKESFKFYNSWFEKTYGEKATSVKYNDPFDRYPDVFVTLESGNELPVEVEWTTKKFDHDPTVIDDGDGLIVVLQNNDPFFGLRQLELNKEHFKSWYVKNSSRIFDESIKEIIVDNKKIKRPPKLWFNYVSASIEKNKEQTLEAGVFGVPDVFRQLHTFKDIRKNDLFCYIGPYKGFKSGGRVQFEDFRKNRKMICKEMSVFRITKDYYYDETKIWDHKINLDDKKIKNYPHRFTFDKTPIFINNNIKMYGLSLTTKKALHQILYSIFWEGKSDTLVDLMSS